MVMQDGYDLAGLLVTKHCININKYKNMYI